MALAMPVIRNTWGMLQPAASRAPASTAEVFAWGDGQVLKLYRAEMPREWAIAEDRVGQVVVDAGLAAPAVGGLVEIEGRIGIIYQRLDGPSMLDFLASHLADIPSLGQQFAELHAQMHTCLRPELPSQRKSLVRAIQYAPPLPTELKRQVLRRLEQLPDGLAVCHGDYHPGNLVMTDHGPVVIDWMTACCGHPVADVARTALMFRLARVPLDYSPQTRQAIDQARGVFYDAYLSSYLAHRPFPVAEIEEWIPVVAAARLSEGIVDEEEQLLRLAATI